MLLKFNLTDFISKRSL